MEISVRDMQADDWNAVTRIYAEGIATNKATFETRCPEYAQWDKAHLAGCRLVAQRGDEVIGWAALSPVSGRCVYGGVAEVSVYIATAARGQGVGTLLLKTIWKEAEDEGLWTLQSGIIQDNEASIRLHEKCGFRMVGYRERIAKDQYGAWRNTVLMERRRPQDEPEKGSCTCCCQK